MGNCRRRGGEPGNVLAQRGDRGQHRRRRPRPRHLRGQATGLAIRGNTVIQDMTTGLNKPINMPRVDVTTVLRA